MKKVLSLVLAFAMILGSFGFVFGSQFPDVGDNEYFSEPINVLSGLGVIDGFTDGTFRPEKTVTRGQMAALIIKALGLPVSSTTNTKFPDCQSDHWASGYVELAESLGIIKGYTDGTFKPDQEVKYNEVLTMIIQGLGYTPDALTGTYPGAYINQARALGILDICKTTGTAPCPRQDVACFLYKALTSPIGKVNKDDEFVPTVTGKDADNKDVFDTMIARLGAVDYAPTEGPNKDKAGGAFVVTGTEKSQINLMNYLGVWATAYANDDKEIVAIKEVKSEFIEGTFDDLDDAYTLDAIKGVKAVYFDNGDVNGEIAVDDASLADVNLKVAVEKSGKKVTAVYSIQAWIPDKAFEADGVADELIDYKTIGGMDLAKDDDDEINTNTFSIVGRGAITEIEDGDIVTVYLHSAADPNGDYKAGDVAKIEVGTETVTGTITKVNKGESDSTAFTIAGTAYGIAFGSALKSDDLYALMTEKTETTFYLDYAGDIFSVADEAEAVKNYAVVLSTSAEKASDGTEKSYATLYLADGTESKIEVDAAKVTDAAPDFGVTPYDWTSPIPAGTVVQYTLDDDGLIDSFKGATSGGTAEVSKTGVVGYSKLAKSAVIFNLIDTTKPEKAASYEVVEASAVYEKEVTFNAFVEDYVIYAMLVENLNSTAAEEAIFVKAGGSDANGALWTALYDGEVKEFTVKTSEASKAEAAKYTTGTAVVFCTLTQDADGTVTLITPNSTTFDDYMENGTGAITVNADGSVTDGDGANFDIADDVAVYIFDGKAWSAKSISAMNVRVNVFSEVNIMYNKDGEVSIIVAIKK